MQIQVIEAEKNKSRVRKKVCAYVRVSTDSEVQEDSLDNQKKHYADYILGNPEWEFAGIYSDQGISGFKEKRPAFQRMIQDARDGKIDLIIVKSVSRFARNTETVLKFSRELKSMGVGIFFELQNINTLSGEGELMLTIIAAFAQAESESNSGNVKTAIRHKFEQGEAVFPVSAIFGYKADEDGNPVINKEEAETVRLIFNLAEKGVWVSRITEYLNKNKIPPKNAEEWQQSSVARLLRQEAYMGDRILQKTYTDSRRRTKKNKGEFDSWHITDTHPAIVSKEQWYKVQEILENRLNRLYDDTPITTENKGTHSRYPLSGKLYCPYCGKVLIHRWEAKKRYENWHCSTHFKISKDACPGVCIPNSVAMEWGELTEPVVVFKYEDEYGMTRFQAYPKEEYEASGECPYEVSVPEPKKIKPKKPTRTKVAKPEQKRYTRKKYPHSGKLYCPYCGKVLTHKWNNDVPYWVCSTNRNWHRDGGGKRCRGFYFPAEIADEWGELDGKVTVVPFFNEYGHRHYTAYPKDEYEQSEECEYGKEE